MNIVVWVNNNLPLIIAVVALVALIIYMKKSGL